MAKPIKVGIIGCGGIANGSICRFCHRLMIAKWWRFAI